MTMLSWTWLAGTAAATAGPIDRPTALRPIARPSARIDWSATAVARSSGSGLAAWLGLVAWLMVRPIAAAVARSGGSGLPAAAAADATAALGCVASRGSSRLAARGSNMLVSGGRSATTLAAGSGLPAAAAWLAAATASSGGSGLSTAAAAVAVAALGCVVRRGICRLTVCSG